jgi:hypothetical protein
LAARAPVRRLAQDSQFTTEVLTTARAETRHSKERTMRLGMRKMLLLGAGLAVAGSGYAFLAGNTLQTAGAGSGTGSVSGYTISNVDTNPNPISGVLGSVSEYQVIFDALPTSAASGEGPAMNASISFSGDIGSTLTTSDTFPCTYNGPVSGAANETQFFCNINSSGLHGLVFSTIDSYTVTATA